MPGRAHARDRLPSYRIGYPVAMLTCQNARFWHGMGTAGRAGCGRLLHFPGRLTGDALLREQDTGDPVLLRPVPSLRTDRRRQGPRPAGPQLERGIPLASDNTDPAEPHGEERTTLQNPAKARPLMT